MTLDARIVAQALVWSQGISILKICSAEEMDYWVLYKLSEVLEVQQFYTKWCEQIPVKARRFENRDCVLGSTYSEDFLIWNDWKSPNRRPLPLFVEMEHPPGHYQSRSNASETLFFFNFYFCCFSVIFRVPSVLLDFWTHWYFRGERQTEWSRYSNITLWSKCCDWNLVNFLYAKSAG